jgi:uncharacterized YigZ family protein
MEQTDILLCYKEIQYPLSTEIIEKKSRFIASLKPVYSEEEALGFIEDIKKKYWNATHNCSAFVVGKKAELIRCNDDGEPSQTAGKPMLEVLMGEEIRNVCVVVTRYFGGTLLGTGGLVRAYQGAVKEVIAAAKIIMLTYGTPLIITTDYNEVGKIQYLFSQKNYKIQNVTYLEQVVFYSIIPYQELQIFKREITEVTCGKAIIVEKENEYYIK